MCAATGGHPAPRRSYGSTLAAVFSDPRHYDQIRFRFHTAKALQRPRSMSAVWSLSGVKRTRVNGVKIDVHDLGCVKTLRGITAPGILGSTVTRRVKNAKICLPLGTTTKSDFVFTRPRPAADMGFDFVRPITQAGISDERLPAGLRQIPPSKTDFSGSYPSEDRHGRRLIYKPTITYLKTSRPLVRVVL